MALTSKTIALKSKKLRSVVRKNKNKTMKSKSKKRHSVVSKNNRNTKKVKRGGGVAW